MVSSLGRSVAGGFTLEGAKTQIKEGKHKTQDFELIQKLESIKAQLLRIKEQL